MRTLIESTNAYKMMEGKGENLHHAYLLLFPDSAFLRKSLPVFAELILTGNRAKQLLQAGSHADFTLLPEEGKKLVVDDVSAIEEVARLRPVEGDRKVIALADFENANQQTQNKLLKILEEPPKGVYFLLAGTMISSILPTVLSRVKKIEIPPFSSAQIRDFLDRNYPNSPNVEAVADASQGHPCKAEKMLFDSSMQELIDGAFALLESGSNLPALCRKWGERKEKQELLSFLKMLCRDALFIQAGNYSLLLPAEKSRAMALASRYSTRALLKGQEALTKGEFALKFNGVFSQILEISLLAMRD